MHYLSRDGAITPLAVVARRLGNSLVHIFSAPLCVRVAVVTFIRDRLNPQILRYYPSAFESQMYHFFGMDCSPEKKEANASIILNVNLQLKLMFG